MNPPILQAYAAARAIGLDPKLNHNWTYAEMYLADNTDTICQCWGWARVRVMAFGMKYLEIEKLAARRLKEFDMEITKTDLETIETIALETLGKLPETTEEINQLQKLLVARLERGEGVIANARKAGRPKERIFELEDNWIKMLHAYEWAADQLGVIRNAQIVARINNSTISTSEPIGQQVMTWENLND